MTGLNENTIKVKLFRTRQKLLKAAQRLTRGSFASMSELTAGIRPAEVEQVSDLREEPCIARFRIISKRCWRASTCRGSAAAASGRMRRVPRAKLQGMQEQAALIRELRAPEDFAADPRPGFYARVMERIEARGPDLHLESLHRIRLRPPHRRGLAGAGVAAGRLSGDLGALGRRSHDRAAAIAAGGPPDADRGGGRRRPARVITQVDQSSARPVVRGRRSWPIWSPIGNNNRTYGVAACKSQSDWNAGVVFLAGAAVGALTMQMGLHERLHRTVSAATLPVLRKAPTNDALVQRFKTELNLSADQTDKIAMVLDDYREYYQSLQDQLDDVRSTGKIASCRSSTNSSAPSSRRSWATCSRSSKPNNRLRAARLARRQLFGRSAILRSSASHSRDSTSSGIACGSIPL